MFKRTAAEKLLIGLFLLLVFGPLLLWLVSDDRKLSEMENRYRTFADIESARQQFSSHSQAAESLLPFARARHLNYTPPGKSKAAVLNKPSFRAELSFYLQGDTVNSAHSIRLVLDSLTTARFELGVSSDNGKSETLNDIPLKKGLALPH